MMYLQTIEKLDTLYDTAATIVEQVLAEHRGADPFVLGLPTGRTPLPLYERLAHRYRQGRIDPAKLRTFNLDEYVGLSPDHPQSFRHYMQEHVWGPLNLSAEQVDIPDGTADSLEAECRRYDDALERAGGLDLLILGLGENGHIGFNEPGDRLHLRTHVTTLTAATREQNAAAFDGAGSVPKQAVTMGLDPIFAASAVLFLAVGDGKEAAAEALTAGKVTTHVPATLLHLHPNTRALLHAPLVATASAADQRGPGKE